MKIAVIGNGGTIVDERGNFYVNRHTADFLVGLAAAGLNTTFIQPREEFREGFGLEDQALRADGLHCIAVERKGIITGFLSSFGAARDIIRSDFVYIFFPGTLPRIVGLFCRIIRKPYGIYLRGEQFDILGADGRLFEQARFIVSVSSLFAERLSPVNQRVRTIRPMLDLSLDDLFARPRGMINGIQLSLLFVGRLEVAKGVPELLRAAEILHAREVDFCLCLVGGGPLYQELFARYGDREGSLIRVLGLISDKTKLMRLYEEADLFVLPTHHEGFPRVLYEAMIKSTVIITTMVGGIPGVMQDGWNCVAIPPKDADAIAEAVELTGRNAALMQALSDAGLTTVRGILEGLPTHLVCVMKELYAFET